jgi:hypothetical protein
MIIKKRVIVPQQEEVVAFVDATGALVLQQHDPQVCDNGPTAEIYLAPVHIDRLIFVMQEIKADIESKKKT